MPDLVKGARASVPGLKPEPITDPSELMKRALDAEDALYAAVKQGLERPDEVRKSLNPSFMQEFGLFMGGNAAGLQGPNAGLTAELERVLSTELGKNITLTSPLASGLVPYDLVAPSRLIYPVFSPLRNRFPRTGGQGTSRRVKLITGITGSQAGGAPAIQRITQSELVGGSLPTWPLNLPASGSQNAVDMNIPYKFAGLTESLSWLAQFAGAGFEDISALANLVLIQEFMMGEEYEMLYSTGTALSTPANPTLAVRTAGTNETALSGVTTNVFVKVTATTPYGETAAQASGAQIAWSSGQVVDVTIAPVKGAVQYNIYVTTGASAGTYHIMQAGVGASKFTLQGALPVAGASPPASDTGTSSANDYEGINSILSGHASADASVYPANFYGGYVNQGIGKTLSGDVVATALQHLWDGSATPAEGFRANPTELWVEGSDAKRLSDDVTNVNAANLAYRLVIDGAERDGVRVGAAVSEIQNPVTRSVVQVVVHPWFTQGTAHLYSYTLPQSYTNVSNVWENVMVQDYLSISWPVIDASYRFSIFMYGALVCYSPQYNGLLQGLQQSAATPYS